MGRTDLLPDIVPFTGAASVPARYSYALGYTATGNILNAADTVNGSWTYGYDQLNRLTAALSATTGLSWSYDSFLPGRKVNCTTTGTGSSCQ